MPDTATNYLNKQKRRIYKSEKGKFYILKDGKRVYNVKALYQGQANNAVRIVPSSVPASIRPKRVPPTTPNPPPIAPVLKCTGPGAENAVRLLAAARGKGLTTNDAISRMSRTPKTPKTPTQIGSNMLIGNLV